MSSTEYTDRVKSAKRHDIFRSLLRIANVINGVAAYVTWYFIGMWLTPIAGWVITTIVCVMGASIGAAVVIYTHMKLDKEEYDEWEAVNELRIGKE